MYYSGTFNDVDDSESDDITGSRPRGLTGLKNLGNTCYMNAALQALSNCQPLTRFFIDCPGYLSCSRDAGLSKIYLKLVQEMWHRNRETYLSPKTLLSRMKQLHPMFKGFLQHDSQEFLRFLMDSLHEEMKEIMPESEVFAESGAASVNLPNNYPTSNTCDLGYDSCSNQENLSISGFPDTLSKYSMLSSLRQLYAWFSLIISSHNNFIFYSNFIINNLKNILQIPRHK